MKRNLNLRSLLVAAAILLVSPLVLAGDPPAEQQPEAAARRATEEAIATRQRTQQLKDSWSDEQAALAARYQTAKANVAWLTGRRAEETARAEASEARVTELGRRLAEADRLTGSMQDTLQVIDDRLERSVAASLPFLPQERRLRLESLSAELVRPDVTAAEKLRRLLEALQVEAGYASSVEVSQDLISVGPDRLHADILRVGRVALFWRTPDGKRVGTYDPAAGNWTELPGHEKRAIGLAMEMATRMRPVEILALPLGRIAP